MKISFLLRDTIHSVTIFVLFNRFLNKILFIYLRELLPTGSLQIQRILFICILSIQNKDKSRTTIFRWCIIDLFSRKMTWEFLMIHNEVTDFLCVALAVLSKFSCLYIHGIYVLIICDICFLYNNLLNSTFKYYYSSFKTLVFFIGVVGHGVQDLFLLY